MSLTAPLCVPVEIAPAGGGEPPVFRLATAVAVDGLRLRGALFDEPEWLAGTLTIAFHLPGDAEAVRCHARAAEVIVDEGEETERAERRLLAFVAPPAAAAARIEQYVEERLGAR